MQQGPEPTAVPWPYCASSAELKQRVRDARVLAVGAGGIGCELLKTLAMTGFQHIEVVDMDTIETSNLNRQFLFRKRHVGQSKSEVAAEAVKHMRPGVDITAYQGNVKEAKYGVDFFRRFDCVLNGLDNLEARRHVNRLCLAAGVPLVESGTAGYLGQVSVHMKGRTECFECQPKPVPKSYPVCTLRNTPDKPIHCVVWAKEMLFPLLFGAPEASDLNDTAAAAAAAEEGEEGASSTVDDPSFYKRREGESSRQFAERVFRQQYQVKIEELRGMEDLWASRRAPEPLNLDALLAPAGNGSSPQANGDGPAAAAAATAAATGSSACKALGLTNAHSVWDVQQNAALFLQTVQMFLDGRPDELGSAQFDKDDELAVEFVTAASNLRSACYGIPMQSLFVTKGMAGNIIHAIATTNAIVSGLIVIEALKLLAGAPGACQTSFLHKEMSGSKRLVSRMVAPEPNPACMVCGQAQAHLAVNTKRMTWQQVVTKVLKGRLALVSPYVLCGTFSYEEGEDLDKSELAENRAHLPKVLSELPGGGLVHGSILELSDSDQQFNAQLVISHREEWDEDLHPEGFELSGSLPAAKVEQPAGKAAAGDAGAGSSRQAEAGGTAAAPAAKLVVQETDEGILLLSSDEEEPVTEAAISDDKGKGKRKAEEGTPAEGGSGGGAAGGSKKARLEPDTSPADAQAAAAVAAAVLVDDDGGEFAGRF